MSIDREASSNMKSDSFEFVTKLSPWSHARKGIGVWSNVRI